MFIIVYFIFLCKKARSKKQAEAANPITINIVSIIAILSCFSGVKSLGVGNR